MKVASSQLSFSGGRTLQIRQEHEETLQSSQSTTSTENPNTRRILDQQHINVRERVSLNSSQRYQATSQTYVTNIANQINSSNNEAISNDKTVDHHALFTNEQIIEKTLNKTYTHSVRADISQLTILEPPPSEDTSTPQNSTSTTAELAYGEYNLYQEEEHTNFSIKGKVTTEDGKHIDFTLSAQLDRNISIEERSGVFLQNIRQTDPLAINLEGGIVTLRDSAFEFDLNADGDNETISFVSKGSGFIVYDKNEDGKINDGNEMFGTQSGNGFKDLRQYDDDGNGVIDENDAIYDKLSVWTKDGAGNDHLSTLRETGVGAIGLEYEDTQFELKDEYNNSLGSIQRSGYFLMENGRAGFAQQVDLSDRNLDQEQATKELFEPPPFTLLSMNALEIPESLGISTSAQSPPMLTLSQATVLTKQASDEVLAKYDEVSSVTASEETKSLLEQLVEKLKQYGEDKKEQSEDKHKDD
ncbi:hypothetical protein A9Q99_03125 [Gammaproteobacteria bacterium 45_16_T64]|nr:hypothetical protein A9Q99_03125 [Gammaproteobacteria bacterium 45_16_T64]